MQKFGIDLSQWQGDFNFAAAKAEGVEFVIVKAGGADAGLYQDERFEGNYDKAGAAGLPIGAYFFGNAFSAAEAVEEADKFLAIIRGKKFEYPLYYDVEGWMLEQSVASLTAAVDTFCKRMEGAGYYAGIYSSESVFNDRMDDRQLAPYAHWVAEYSVSPPKLRSGNVCGIWQYGGEENFIRSNKVAGVVCDQNYCYVDYPEVIKRSGLNGYAAGVISAGPVWDDNGQGKDQSSPVGTDTALRSAGEIAREVIAGRWGNGAERRARLTAAGYNYAVIQRIVNRLLA